MKVGVDVYTIHGLKNCLYIFLFFSSIFLLLVEMPFVF